MKKVLFILPSFGIGGTTVSTRNLLSLLDKEEYDCTVWCLDGQGLLKGLYDDLPQVQPPFFVHALAIDSWKFEKGWLRKVAAALARLTKHIPVLYRLLVRRFIRTALRGRHFDTVIACQEGFASAFAAFIPANNRVAWVRCDYARYYKQYGCRKEQFYKEYQHIVCVAEQSMKSFIDIYPEWKGKTTCIYNPQDSNLILSQSTIDDHDPRFRTDKTVILSMGRLGTVKRFDQIPSIGTLLGMV